MSDDFPVKVTIELPFGVYGTTLELTVDQAAKLYERLGELFAVDIVSTYGSPGYCTPPQVTR